MSKMQQIIYATNSLSTGILLPVLTLVILEKGSTLQTLPLLLALFSLTVLCLELPSGILADMYGRKAVFLMSCGFQFASFFLLIVARNIILLIPAVIFFGLGRAFSSGSLDALFIDQALETHGEDCLPKVTARLAVLEGSGLAVGGLAGGFIASITGTYTSNVILRLVLTVILLILCLAFVKEQPLHTINQQNQRTSLIDLIKQGKQVIFSAHELGFILLGVFSIGFFLFSIETYWQPAFMEISTMESNSWLLGVITFIGFFAITAGNAIAQKLLDRLKNSWWSIYGICRIIMTFCILMFTFQRNASGFIIWYAGIYLALGTGNVVESTLINKYTPNNMRASMLSLNSFVTQAGGLCASLFSSLMIMRLQFSGIWIVAGLLLGSCTIFVTVITNIRKTRMQEQ